MSGVNKVILVGRMGKDPDVRTLDNGAMVASFSMATSESYKDKTTGEKKEITEWHNVVLWRGLAEIASKYLHKGDLIFIEGKMRTRSWEKDNVKRYTTEIVGDNMTMLSTQRSGSTGGTPSGADQYANNNSTSSGESNVEKKSEHNLPHADDLPF